MLWFFISWCNQHIFYFIRTQPNSNTFCTLHNAQIEIIEWDALIQLRKANRARWESFLLKNVWSLWICVNKTFWLLSRAILDNVLKRKCFPRALKTSSFYLLVTNCNEISFISLILLFIFGGRFWGLINIFKCFSSWMATWKEQRRRDGKNENESRSTLHFFFGRFISFVRTEDALIWPH